MSSVTQLFGVKKKNTEILAPAQALFLMWSALVFGSHTVHIHTSACAGAFFLCGLFIHLIAVMISE